jgi:hypothetical protein
VRTVKNVYREKVCLNGIRGSKTGRESLQDDERKDRSSVSRKEESTEVIQKCLAEDQVFGC